MTITQTIEIPADRRLFLELPCSVPSGIKAQVSIAIPIAFESQSTVKSQTKSFRGVLKGKGISIERLREMQREDKAFEDAVDNRRNQGIR